jgi:hypothetical protein
MTNEPLDDLGADPGDVELPEDAFECRLPSRNFS